MNACISNLFIRLGGMSLAAGLLLPFPAAAGTLCAGDEKVVFSCPSDVKFISVCGTDRGVQYRYGNPGKVETVFPPAPSRSGVVSAGELKYPQGGGMYLRFAAPDAEYVVYSAGDGDWEQSGIAVLRAGKQVAEHICLPESAEMENFHNFNVDPDQGSFAVQVKNAPGE